MSLIDQPSLPAEILRSTPAPDDAGAATADRYEWQAMMATADLMSLYFLNLDEGGNLSPESSDAILCEHHEDWAITSGDDAEIVSAKHREASVGPFTTYRQLLDNGGVLHLFERWVELGESPRCRLVTTGGLAKEGSTLADACDRLRENQEVQHPSVEDALKGIADAIVVLRTTEEVTPETPPELKLRRFLAVLKVDHGQPRRDHVPDMAGSRYGRPVAERLGCPEAAQAIWTAVLGLVRERMRAAGPTVGGKLPTVLGVGHDDPLAPRILSLADVEVAVRIAIKYSTVYVPLPRMIKANRMAVKMARGGCSDNAIERADSLRLQFRRYWSARRSNPVTFDRRRALENTLLRVADEVTHVVRVDGEPWGAQLWHQMGTRFRGLEGQPDAHGLDGDLLLGGAADLANNCHVWFTDRFDAQDELRRLIAEERAS